MLGRPWLSCICGFWGSAYASHLVKCCFMGKATSGMYVMYLHTYQVWRTYGVFNLTKSKNEFFTLSRPVQNSS